MSGLISIGAVLLSKLEISRSSDNPDQTYLPTAGAWRPPQWGKKAQTVLTVPVTSQATQVSSAVFYDSGGSEPTDTVNTPAPKTSPIVYVFDSVLTLLHQTEIKRTEYPVQTGSSISDHAYRRPARLTLEIGMSDAMDSYVPNSWTGDQSKSVSAYQTLLTISKSRVLVNVTTRLNSYLNMLIESVTASDSSKTQHGLRATVTLSEVFLAKVVSGTGSSVVGSSQSDTKVSARPNATNSTNSGTAQTANPSPSVMLQHLVIPAVAALIPKVLGAGNWASGAVAALPVSQIPAIPGI